VGGTFTNPDGGGKLAEASTPSDSQAPPSDSGVPEGGAAEAGGQDSAVDAPPPPIMCNNLTPTGPTVSAAPVTSSQPTPAGGTISAGTYFLTEVDLYNVDPEAGAPSTPAVRRTLVIDTTAMTLQLAEAVASAGGGTSAVDTSTSSYVVYNDVLSLSPTCPVAGAVSNVSFTFQSGKLSLFATDKIDVYTLQ
jgi:hypothetical protein